MKKLLALLLAAWVACMPALANEGGHPLDKFPKDRLTDMAALQNGAKLFVNYCLNCHAASYARYNRMRDIGLSDEQIKKNLLFAGEKVGELMKVSLDPRQAKEWFGALPPDLSIIARSRAGNGGSGADYLYTYMRTFYRDETKATGWNNLVFPSVGMPHVLWELQGVPRAVFEKVADAHDPKKTVLAYKGMKMEQPGQMSQLQFDNATADLVGYLQWMGEPEQNQRFRMGVWVVLFLLLLTIAAWRLNASYWKDVK